MKSVLITIAALCVASVVGMAQPSERQCARQMCDQIRQCTTSVQYPDGGQVPEGVEKPKGPVKKQNADVQGREPNSCHYDAYMDYLACALGGGNKVNPPLKKTTVSTPR